MDTNSLRCVTIALAAITLSSATVLKPSASGDNFELLILHNNDMHARFEQTSQLSGACTTDDREAGKCYGGFPRVAHVVKEARKAAQSGEGPPVLYLNAGDTYTGTAWFTIYKWKIAAEFINALQPDAVSLGNNELEHGSKELSPFLNNIDTKILASNVIVKFAENNENIKKYVVFDINGVKVGVIGYLTPDFNILDSSGNIEYIDEVIALTDEVSKLRELDVNIIIALGHSNPEKNIEIAREVDGIDVIICGYKNNFYWNGTSTAHNVGDEIVVIQSSGKEVPVIYSYAYDKYLGNLIMSFDSNGELIKFNSNPIILDSTIVEDVESYHVAEKYYKELSQRSEEVVGTTSVVLHGEHCRTEECNLGNLITDAIMYYNAINFETEEPWTDAPVAIIHGGAIATSISPSNRPASVTRGDLLSALPLASNIVAITINGTILSQVLEHSVADYDSQNPSGRFLQFSGIRVVYDIAREPGSRVVHAVARCGTCYVPEFYNIDDWRSYKLLMPAALADGEFGYTMFTGLPRQNYNHDEVTCTGDYINRRSPVYPEIAGRIVLQNVPIIDDVPDSASTLSASLIFVVLLSLIFH